MFSLEKMLKDHYGIDRVTISPEQGGWTALAYQVIDGDPVLSIQAGAGI
ncbi:hypothetical protein QMZ64_16410 [Bacillus sp. LB7]|nr:hypothetical protein [Bacillus sp. LB7]MDN5389002.1 hypothetical protein [Bacillus sp. LB7]